MPQHNQLLDGIRVIDLSQYIPGPFATRQFADLGADVIKVEPLRGDPMQTLFQNSAGESPVYAHLNRGKRILRIDLKTSDGLEVLKELVVDCDILLESFRPGVLDRLGLGRTVLETLNSGLIHCALSGFGQNGPYSQKAGHDLTYCAVAGALGASGTSDRPIMSYPPVADHAGAMQAATTVLAALVAKNRSGVGRYIDISLYEPILSWQYLHIFDSDHKREAMQINGGLACYKIYQTADKRFVALAALEAKFWSAFCEAVGQADWVVRHSEARPQTSLSGAVQKLFESQSQAYWSERLSHVDCCFEAIPSAEEIATHPQLKARQMMQENAPLYPAWINDCAPDVAASVIYSTDALAWFNR